MYYKYNLNDKNCIPIIINHRYYMNTLTYSSNCVLFVEHPKANSIDSFSEIDFVVLYKLNILLNVLEPVLFFTPIQNAASLISAEILNIIKNIT